MERIPASEKTSVFLYIPNLIGYVRLFLVILAFRSAYRNLELMVLYYTLSQLMDALDGWSARKLSQASVLGGVLDQVTDRMSTVGSYLVCAIAFPDYFIYVLAAMTADLAGHWIWVNACFASNDASHKNPSENLNIILRLYYSAPGCMFVTHTSYEAFWILLFCSSQLSQNADISGYSILSKFFTSTADASSLALWGAYLSAPLAFFKVVTNALQGLAGLRLLARLPLKEA